MKIINDVLTKDRCSDHDKNMEQITSEINKLLFSKFNNCTPLIQKIIISDNIDRLNNTLKYNINPEARGTVHRLTNGFAIIFNYNKLIFIEEGRYCLDIIVNNIIYHELCHVRDFIKYDELIDKLALELKLKEFDKYLGKQIFLEFNAQYRAQLYEPIIWECNAYSLDTNIDKYHNMYEGIIKCINELNINDLYEFEKRVKLLSEDISYFSSKIMYDFSLSFGSNAADNKKNTGKKFIDIKIKGINSDIDKLLNSFIEGFNEVINDNKSILNYSFNKGTSIFYWMLEIYNNKSEVLDKEFKDRA